MARACFTFPSSFLFGTATAGYQVEGGSLNTDFWQWEHQPGRIAADERSGPACDWWHGQRWRDDFDRAAADGHTALRMSVEWSRIEPEPGRWDEDALDHYRQMVVGLRQRGLTPLVTLHHFVNPLWTVSDGRHIWEDGSGTEAFARYARKVVEALGSHVDLWATINEPNVYYYNGWMAGAFPPGDRPSIGRAMQVARNLLLAHAAAYQAIHDVQPHALVGLPIHFRPTLPAHPGFLLDEWVARTQFELFSSLFNDAISTGRMRRPFGTSLAVPEARGTLDYFGLNYYTTDLVRFDPTSLAELFGRRSFPSGAEVDDAGWYASYPPGMFSALTWARKQHLPIYITENGIGDAEDRMRPRYLIEHLRQIWRGVNFNWDVRGYFHWSLVDNFEWERGWTHRFGLYALDRVSQIRTPRRSAELYAAICRRRALDSDMVADFAPELLERLFPG